MELTPLNPLCLSDQVIKKIIQINNLERDPCLLLSSVHLAKISSYRFVDKNLVGILSSERHKQSIVSIYKHAKQHCFNAPTGLYDSL